MNGSFGIPKRETLKGFWVILSIQLLVETHPETVFHVTAWIWRRNYSSILLRSEDTPKTNPLCPTTPGELARDRLTIRGHFGHMASASASASLVTSPPVCAAYPETAKKPLVLISHNRWRCWFLSGFPKYSCSLISFVVRVRVNKPWPSLVIFDNMPETF